MSNINIKELARQLNLSTSTVSRAFTGHSEISHQTKERIFKAARELQYQPNHYGSSLRTQRSRNIAIIIPQITNNFFSQAINGIETVTRKNGYHLLIYLTGDSFDSEVAYVHNLHNGSVEGIIMSVSGASNNYSYIGNLKEKQIPLVLFNSVYDDLNIPKVTTDDYISSYEATMHLVSSGCENIAFLVSNKQFSTGRLRMQGYLRAVEQAGLPNREGLIIECGSNEKENFTRIAGILKEQAVDGVFAAAEHLAFSAYQVCHNLNLAIPHHVKIISFSSLEIASLLNPSLTTITQPAYDMGVHAATLLFKMLGQKDPVNDQIVLSSKLTVRDSTCSVA